MILQLTSHLQVLSSSFFFIMIKRCCCFLIFWDRFADDVSLYSRKLNRKYYYLFFCSSEACFMREWTKKMIWLISRIIRDSLNVNKYWTSVLQRQRSWSYIYNFLFSLFRRQSCLVPLFSRVPILFFKAFFFNNFVAVVYIIWLKIWSLKYAVNMLINRNLM